MRTKGAKDGVKGNSINKEQFETIGKRWLKQYFCRPNYYKIDNKPVISIYALKNFVKVPRPFIKTVLNGCVDWAKENGYLITEDYSD